MAEKKTYIINVDGMRADYLDTQGHQGCLTPTLLALMKNGACFTNCMNIMPANTGTNHTGILTSTHAGSHGILGVGGCYKGLDKKHFPWSKKYGTPITGMYQNNHLQVPSFYNIIKNNNPDLTTAFIPGKTWVGDIIPDKDCDITIYPGNTPGKSDYHSPNPGYVTETESYVVGGVAHPEDNEILPRFFIPKKGEIEREPPMTINLALVNIHADVLPSDKWIIDQAINCIQHDDPDFIYMIIMNMDLAGHIYGAFLEDEEPEKTDGENLSPLRNPNATRDQLFITDREIKRFIDYLHKKELFDQARIIITSDHGMNTTKSRISGVSRKKRLYWLLHKLHLIKWPEVYKSFLFRELKEKLFIDIRKILSHHGIHMRASQGKWRDRYNKKGDYDWCFSDGGIVGYIFNADTSIQREIETILTEYTITEGGININPIWKVLIQKDMNDAENDYTKRPFCLGRGEFNDEYDAQWPSVIVFPKPHYMIPLYRDQIGAGLMPFMLPIPSFFDVQTAPGLHGTYLEQHVPLIFVSPDENEIPPGKVVEEQVSVLDIIPTVNALNNWEEQSTFEGNNLFETN